jgi:SAM-dependent MidA family methyltransferase
LLALIRETGPISVERFMALALGHPRHGYYMTRDPLGRGGDFTTAPEISQMFGELLAIWAMATWQEMGAPAQLRLVELGPGRGTLMADLLRAARALPPFHAALACHLVETSPVLVAEQQHRLRAVGVPCSWHGALATVPADRPTILLANEFLDALPVRQFVRAGAGWHERLVGASPQGELHFGLAPEAEPGLALPAAEGAVLEVPSQALTIMRTVAERLLHTGGAALFIDYGHADSGEGPPLGDTLQAMHRHGFVPVLERPGEVDITSHVSFGAMARAAAGAGARVHGPIPQGALLQRLGLSARVERLRAGATPEQAAAILAAAERLTDPAPTGMGHLFKALALSHPDLATLPAFETPDA